MGSSSISFSLEFPHPSPEIPTCRLLGLAQLITNSLSFSKTVEQNSEWSNLNNSLQLALKAQCSEWIKNDKQSPLQLPLESLAPDFRIPVSIRRNNETLAIKDLALNGSGGRLDEVALRLTDPLPAPSSPTDIRGTRAQLLISLSRGSALGGARKNNSSAPIRMRLEFDGTNTLRNCGLESDSDAGARYSEAFWNSSGSQLQTTNFEIVDQGMYQRISGTIAITPANRDRVSMLETQVQFILVGPGTGTAAFVGIETSLNSATPSPCGNDHTANWSGAGLKPSLGTTCTFFVPAGASPKVHVKTEALPSNILVHDPVAAKTKPLVKIVDLTSRI